MKHHLLLSFCALLALFNAEVRAQNDTFFTLTSTKARPLAMGGAFTAVEDDVAAIDYNPAAFFLYRNASERRVAVFLNPVGATVGAVRNDAVFRGSGNTLDDILLTAGLMVRSVSLRISSVDFGILLGEQNLDPPGEFQHDAFFRIDGLRQNHSHSIVASLKLARRVSVGGSASYLVQSNAASPFKAATGGAISYGILMQPESNLRIGVFYTNFADTLGDFRSHLLRLADESVNIGASYSPFPGTSLALDLRNLGEEGGVAAREVHSGIEQILFSHLALRAGFFRKDNDYNTFSFGVGLFDGNYLFRPEKRFDHRNFLLNYSLVYEKAPFEHKRWHFLTFMLKV
jgi:hypothetical protein